MLKPGSSQYSKIGKLVFTLRNNEKLKNLEILDIDLTLDAAAPVSLRFLEKLPDSSDANEYYDIATVEDEIHLQVETVNRHAVKGNIVDTVQQVRACAFPFRLDTYDDLDALNASLKPQVVCFLIVPHMSRPRRHTSTAGPC